MSTHQTATELPIHPMAFIPPEADAEDLAGIEASIKEKGVIGPVTVWKNPSDGNKLYVIDGRTRVTIADNLGIEYPIAEFVGEEKAAVAFVLDKSVNRRHLTSTQKAAIILDCNRYLVAQGLAHGSAEQKAVAKERDKVRRQHGIGEDTMHRVRRAVARRPELMKKLKAGTMSAREADSLAREVRDEVIEQIESEPQGMLGKMAAWNARIDQDCRKLKGMLPSLVEGRDESRAEIIKARMNSLCADLRHDKAHAECGYCGGAGCKKCGGRGWLNKIDSESMPASKRKGK